MIFMQGRLSDKAPLSSLFDNVQDYSSYKARKHIDLKGSFSFGIVMNSKLQAKTLRNFEVGQTIADGPSPNCQFGCS